LGNAEGNLWAETIGANQPLRVAFTTRSREPARLA
jgi:hypothetical protein